MNEWPPEDKKTNNEEPGIDEVLQNARQLRKDLEAAHANFQDFNAQAEAALKEAEARDKKIDELAARTQTIQDKLDAELENEREQYENLSFDEALHMIMNFCNRGKEGRKIITPTPVPLSLIRRAYNAISLENISTEEIAQKYELLNKLLDEDIQVINTEGEIISIGELKKLKEDKKVIPKQLNNIKKEPALKNIPKTEASDIEKQFNRLYSEIISYVDEDHPIPYSLFREIVNRTNRETSKEDEVLLNIHKGALNELGSDEKFKIRLNDGSILSWKEYLADKQEIDNKELLPSVIENIKAGKKVTAKSLQDLFESKGISEADLDVLLNQSSNPLELQRVSQKPQNKILLDMRKLINEYGLKIIHPDGTEEAVPPLKFLAVEPLEEPETVAAPVPPEDVANRVIDPNEFRDHLSHHPHHLEHHAFELVQESLDRKMKNLDKKDAAKFHEIFKESVEHHEHSPKHWIEFIDKISKLLITDESLRIGKDKRSEFVEEFKVLKKELLNVELAQDGEISMFKGDAEILHVFKGLGEKKKRIDEEYASKMKSIKSKMDAPNETGEDLDEYTIALMNEEIGEMLKYAETTRDILGNELKELKLALGKKEILLEEKRHLAEVARLAMEGALASNDRGEIIRTTDLYQKAIGEFNEVNKLVSAIKIRIDSKVEALHHIHENIEKMEEQEATMNTSQDLKVVAKASVEAKELAKEVDEAYSMKGHEHSHHHETKETFRNKLKRWGIVGGGIMSGLLVLFAQNLWNTLRDQKMSIDGGGHGHGGGGHKGGHGGGHHH